ncbi:MAG: S8 family serine peptidase [Steroidobacteraceae bacterium]
MRGSGIRKSCSRSAAASALLGLAALFSPAAPANAGDAWRARVSVKLLALYDAAVRGQVASSSSSSAAGAPSSLAAPFAPHIDQTGRVQIDVHYACASSAPRPALTSAGLSIVTEVDVPPFCVTEGWAAPAALARIASVAGVTSVTLPRYALPPHAPGRSPGGAPGAPARSVAPGGSERAPRERVQSPAGSLVDGNGVSIMRADQFVAQTRSAGAGVTVGVQSTGVASLALIQQRGELPAVQVLTPSDGSNSNFADEGTALLEEVHAVAPAAALAFCGPNTFVQYTSCLQQLISAGATILVDDVIFLGQDLMSADDASTQAVEQLLTQNPSVALFTVVGNYNGSYWEGDYTPVSLASQGLPVLTCPLGSGTSQTDAYAAEFGSSPSEQLTVKQNGSFPLMFAWADPADANVSRFDVYWSNNADSTQSGCFSTAGVNGNVITPNVALTAGTYTLTVATPDASAAGKLLKLWLGGDGLTFLSTATPGGIVSAQAYAPGAITIGAVNGSDGTGNQIEQFSSVGPLSLVFPTPQSVQAPTLVAPDGIYVDAAGTYFAGYLFPDGNFYGTSASAPNAAAVAALLRGAFPTLTVPQLVKTLTSGAAPLGSSVPDSTYGYGRIDALGALATLAAPTITALPDSTIDAGASTAPLAFSASGTGSLRFIVTSSNPALVPAAIVGSGAPGVSIAPSACGVSVSSCTATVTAAAGAGGMTNVTLYAVDGANRSAPATMAITVNGPPPSASAPPTATGSATAAAEGGGGAFGWPDLAVLAMLALASVMRASRASAEPG